MNKLVNYFRESSLARFLIPAGITLIAFGVVSFIINTKNQDYIKTEATVSNTTLTQEAYTDVDGNYNEATYDIDVRYTVDGNEYESKLSGLPKYEIGKKLTIYYNPTDPNQITQTKSIILPLAIIAVGLVTLVSGIISGISKAKKL